MKTCNISKDCSPSSEHTNFNCLDALDFGKPIFFYNATIKSLKILSPSLFIDITSETNISKCCKTPISILKNYIR